MLRDLRALEDRDFGFELQKYFRPQNPVDRVDLLQGRQGQVRQVDRAVASTGRSVFVWGDRGVGKTSLAIASAQNNLPTGVHPLVASCDSRSSALSLVKSIIEDLIGKDPLKPTLGLSAELALGPLKLAADRSTRDFEITNINDAVRLLSAGVDKWRENFRGFRPIVIVDEFDLLPEGERRYFGDLVKQIGDRQLMTTFMFCGVSESFEDLLAGHESAYRYIEAVQLERLYLDDAMEILKTGATALGLEVHPDHQLRAAQISDGFPHFIHLIGSSLFWEYYEDKSRATKLEPRHFETGIIRAVQSTEKRLQELYNKATRKYTGGWDYILWAAADHHQLNQSSTTIFDSYCRIVKDALRVKANDPASTLPEVVSSNEKRQDPFDRARFNTKMNALKNAPHGHVLRGSRSGWYRFGIPMLRGYCRLIAHRHGIRLGIEYPISKPYPTT
ncbi:MAG: ATP-binding protein [Thermoanaerobaculia bacterium]|jgi:hypothetical protein